MYMVIFMLSAHVQNTCIPIMHAHVNLALNINLGTEKPAVKSEKCMVSIARFQLQIFPVMPEADGYNVKQYLHILFPSS